MDKKAKSNLVITLFLLAFFLVFYIGLNILNISANSSFIEEINNINITNRTYIDELRNTDIINQSIPTTTYYNGTDYVPIDTTLSVSTFSNYNFEMTKGLYKAYFKNNSNLDSPVRFEKDGYYFIYDISEGQLLWAVKPGQPAATDTLGSGASSNSLDTQINISGNKALYQRAYYNTNVTYELNNETLKENFVLYGLPSFKDYTYLQYSGEIRFNRSLQICTETQCFIPSGTQDDFETSGKIYFKDMNNKTIFYLKEPTITDFNGNTIPGVYKVRGSDAQMQFYLRINKTFLETAVYPVYIDPTVALEPSKFFSYNSSEKEVIISSKEETILDLKLLTPYRYFIAHGEEDTLIAKFYLKEYNENLGNIFDSINFYNINEGYTIKEKEYWYKYGIEYNYTECHNLSYFEPWILENNEIEDVEICSNSTMTNWTRFNDIKELPSKDIVIGLFTDARNEKKIEWVGRIGNLNILQWSAYEVMGVSSYTDSDGAFSLDSIFELKVTSDGNYIITASSVDDYVSIFNITNKSITPVSTYTDNSGAFSVDGVYDFEVTSDGNYIIVGSLTDDYVSIFNITNKSITPVSTLYDADGNFSVDAIGDLILTNDDNYLIVSSQADDYISIFNITNKSITPVSTYTDTSGDFSVEDAMSLEVTQDGNYLIATSNKDDYISIFNITNKSITPVSTYRGTYSYDVGDMEITSDGNYLIASTTTNNRIAIFNITNKSITLVSTFYDTDSDFSVDTVFSLKLTSDDNYLIVGSKADNYVSMFNITNKSITPVVSYTDTSGDFSIYGIYSLDLTNDNNYIITSSSSHDTISVMQIGEGLVSPPTYSHISFNNSVVNEITKFSINVSDNSALSPNGQYIFSTNNTGEWINDTAVNFTSNPSWANITKILNSTVGTIVGYRWYFTDDIGNTNSTPIYTLNTTQFILRIINPTTINPLDIFSYKNISIYFNFSFYNSTNITSNLAINNITIGGKFANIVSPVTNTLITQEGFEGSFLPDGWTTGGNANWNRNTTYTINGSACAKSGSISNSQISWINYTKVFNASGYVSFHWNVSSETNFDYLCYCLDKTCGGTGCSCLGSSGTGDARITSTTSGVWTSGFVNSSFNSGEHSFTWCYMTDGGTLSGNNTGIIDNITFIQNSYTSPEYAYINNVGWNVNVTVPVFESGLKDLFVNATYGGLTYNDTETNAINYGGATGPQWLNRSIYEGVNYGDFFTKVLSFIRAPTQPITEGDWVSVLRAFFRTTYQPITNGDFVNYMRRVPVGTFQEVSPGDLVTRMNLFKRGTYDSTTISDTQSDALQLSRLITANLGVSDAYNKLMQLFRTTNQPITEGDSLSYLRTVSRNLYEGVTQGDLISTLRAFFRNSNQPVTYTDSSTRFISLFRNINEQVTSCEYPFNISDLTVWYTFEDYNATGIFDKSGLNQFGAFGGGISTSDITTGVIGNGIMFDGVDDDNCYRVDVQNNTPTHYQNFTSCIWYKPNTSGGYFFGQGDDYNPAYGWHLINSGGNVNGAIGHGAGGLNYIGTGCSILYNSWNLVCLINNGTNFSLYRENSGGKCIQSETMVNITYKPGNEGFDPIRIGVLSNSYAYYPLNGSVDGVMVFNRSLSYSEVEGIYDLQSNERECIVTTKRNFFRGTYQGISEYDLSTRLSQYFRGTYNPITEGDLIDYLRTVPRDSNNQISYNDFVSSMRKYFRGINQEVDEDDFISVLRNFFRGTYQDIDESDINSRNLALSRLITSNIGLSDVFDSLRLFLRNPNQEISFNSLVLYIKGLTVDINQPISYNDLINYIKGVNRDITQQITYEDSIIVLREYFRNINVNFDEGDFTTYLRNLNKNLDDSITYEDLVTTLREYFRETGQEISFYNLFDSLKEYLINPTDEITILDSIIRERIFPININEELTFLDVVYRNNVFIRVINDILTFFVDDGFARLWVGYTYDFGSTTNATNGTTGGTTTGGGGGGGSTVIINGTGIFNEGVIVARCGTNSLGELMVCGYVLGEMIWPSAPNAGLSLFVILASGIFIFIFIGVRNKKEEKKKEKALREKQREKGG